ncbi:hypothetical protein lbkm_3755 [Lachnospiraceae bacterium KM106-2]|nr:hypothetical protein lbkm_3755 [Lachnospiraceae bacterium KM106-2]
MKGKLYKKVMSILVSTTIILASLIPEFGKMTRVYAQTNDTISVGAGSYSTKVRGTTETQTNASLFDKMPYKGSAYRHTTENYTGPLDTSDWATSFLWDFSGTEPYSHSVFAIPLAYKACSQGMMVTSPSTIADNTNGAYLMPMPEDGSLTDFIFQPNFQTSDAKVDKVTDWTYDIEMQDRSDSSRYMKTTMVQGSPFAYFQFAKSDQVTIVRKRNGLPSRVVWYNGSNLETSNILVFRVYDNADGAIGYEDYDYYAVYAPEGTKFALTSDGSNIGSVKATFPQGKAYLTFATLCASYGTDDEKAKSICNKFKPYAYNFVTNTTSKFSYDEKTSIVSTTYSYEVDKKAESTADGTIMGILPHQYKNMGNASFIDQTFRTIRGTLKLMTGTSYTTKLKYSGFLPYMPKISKSDSAALKNYVSEYRTKNKNDYFRMSEGTGDTYWTGKALNRVGNVLAAAEAVGDEESSDSLYKALKGKLEDWFSTNDTETDNYFYYDAGLGSLFGFPQSYNSVDQLNDHHFHYGYYIYAAAQVALRDPSWGSDSQYGGMVKELINDIACYDRDSSRYPFLRNFSVYEGHSWASGHQAFADGNNQESSSEALNAWAGIIMFGEATGDTKLRDLGIYLYTTEISAVNNYWFDLDKDIFDDRYRYGVSTLDGLNKSTAQVKRNQSSMVWGGKYVYGTWWTAEPLQVQGINLLPMNPASFYLAADKQYIKDNLKLALYHENNYSGSDKLATPTDRWNDIWSEYEALADPDYALTYWNTSADEENGESRAHTYHYIEALKNYGTPNTSITSDSVLSTVFEKNKVKTYCAFNAESKEKVVTFSDGKEIVVQPHTMGIVSESDKVSDYTIEYYKENLAGTGYEKETETKQGEIGAEVTAEDKTVKGFTFDKDNKSNVLSGIVKSDGSLVLKLYYKRNTATITYHLNGGTNNKNNVSSYKAGSSFQIYDPTYEGHTFLGWYANENFTGSKITAITSSDVESLDLYAKWKVSTTDQDDTTAKGCEIRDGKLILFVNDTPDANEVIAYYRIYDTKAAAEAAVLNDLPGYRMSKNDGKFEYQVGEVDTTKYIAYAFNQAGADTPQVRALNNLTEAEESEQTGKGCEIKDGKLILYVNDSPEANEVIAYYRIYDTRSAAERAVLNDLPGYQMTKEGSKFEYQVGKLDTTKYLVYAFNQADADTPKVVPLSKLLEK